MPNQNLSRFVFRHYLRSALVPVLTVELLIILIYFGVNSWVTRQTERTLGAELERTLPYLALEQARGIDAHFESIRKGAAYFARRHRDIELDPDSYHLVGEQPEFAKDSAGSVYQTNRVGSSSLFFPASSPPGPRQMRIARATAFLGPLYEHFVQDYPNVAAVYYNTADNMNRLHPFIEDVWKQYPATLRMADYNFYYLADSIHNPGRHPVWTGAYLDPAGNGWMVSCIAPVYAHDSLAGVVGTDVTIKAIVDSLLGRKLPWNGSAFLADDSGMILAMPETVEGFLGLKELKAHVYSQPVGSELLKPQEYSLFRHPDSALARAFHEEYRDSARVRSAVVGGNEVFLVQAKVPATGWRVFMMVRADDVFSAVNDQARTSRQIGWGVLAIMIGFYVLFFGYLRRKAQAISRDLASPIERLAEATSQLGTGAEPTSLPKVGITELDGLTANFNQLASELEARNQELVASRVEAGLRAKESELSYARGLYESASGYLHNVGNLTARLSSGLMDIEEIARTAPQYPEMFRRVREEGVQGPSLAKIEKILVGKVFPALDGAVGTIGQVRTAIHQTIEHQQSAFLESNRPKVTDDIDLTALLGELCAEFSTLGAARGIAVESDLAPGVRVSSVRNQVSHGLRNGLRNAFDAIGDRAGRVRVVLEGRRHDGRCVVTITDDGVGVPLEGRGKLFTAGYTTKPDGHGLGLHSFAVFLSANNGKVLLESEGLGRGASLIVEVGDV